jgi:hypothetical protein
MSWNNPEYSAMVLLVLIGKPAASRETFFPEINRPSPTISVERILPSNVQTMALQLDPFRYRGALLLNSEKAGPDACGRIGRTAASFDQRQSAGRCN